MAGDAAGLEAPPPGLLAYVRAVQERLRSWMRRISKQQRTTALGGRKGGGGGGGGVLRVPVSGLTNLAQSTEWVTQYHIHA